MFASTANAWFVVQVVPRSECRVASILTYKGYQPFAPTYASTRRWSDRIKTIEKPLFPGYVFVRNASTAVTGLIHSTPGVMRILSAGGRPSLVPDAEIAAVQRLTVKARPKPAQHLTIGQRIEILDGPFAGIAGIIRRIKNRASLIVSIQLISQSISIDLDEHQLGSTAVIVDDRYGAEIRGGESAALRGSALAAGRRVVSGCGASGAGRDCLRSHAAGATL